MCCSLIPVPIAKCQCGCPRFSAWLRTVDNRRLGGKQKAAGNSHHWNGGWIVQTSKAGPGEGYSVRHRQEVSTVSATNSGVVGSAMAESALTMLTASYTLHVFTLKNIHICLVKTPFILSVNC